MAKILYETWDQYPLGATARGVNEYEFIQDSQSPPQISWPHPGNPAIFNDALFSFDNGLEIVNSIPARIGTQSAKLYLANNDKANYKAGRARAELVRSSNAGLFPEQQWFKKRWYQISIWMPSDWTSRYQYIYGDSVGTLELHKTAPPAGLLPFSLRPKGNGTWEIVNDNGYSVNHTRAQGPAILLDQWEDWLIEVLWDPFLAGDGPGGSGGTGYMNVWRNEVLIYASVAHPQGLYQDYQAGNKPPYVDFGLYALPNVNNAFWPVSLYVGVVQIGDENETFESMSIGASTPLIPPVRINCGSGNTFVDSSGNTWKGDSYFTGGVNSSTSNAVAGTTDDGRYQTARTATGSETIQYNIPIENGDYFTNLYFNDFGSSQGGQVVFNIDIGGNRVLTNFDPFSEVGSNTALQKSFPYTVTNNNLNILFSPTGSNLPKFISDIEVLDQTPVQDIIFTPNGGNFEVEQIVTLSTTTTGATIKFTVDGTDPKTSGTAITYTGPVTVTQTTSFRAYGFKIGFIDSNETSATFTEITPVGVSTKTFISPYEKIVDETWPFRKFNKLFFLFSERNGNQLNGLSPIRRIGTINNGSWSKTERGYSVNFNGTDTTITVPHSDELNPGISSFTIECWIKPTDLVDAPNLDSTLARAIYSKYLSSTDRLYIRIRNTTYIQMFWSVSGTINFIDITNLSKPLVNNVFNHLVFTLDRKTDTAYVYIDGVFAGSTTKNLSGANIVNTGTVSIGARDTGDNFFNGWIQKFSFYKGIALIGIQAQNLYHRQYPELIDPSFPRYEEIKFVTQTTQNNQTVSNSMSLSGSLSTATSFFTSVANTLGLSGDLIPLQNVVERFQTISNNLGLSSSLSTITDYIKTISSSIGLSGNSMNKIFLLISNSLSFSSDISNRSVEIVVNTFNTMSSSIRNRIRRGFKKKK